MNANLIQILLPLTGPDGQPFPSDPYSALQEELTQKFGGLTFHRSAPAAGLWKTGGEVEEDAIVVAEVMTSEVDHDWWTTYRIALEQRFRQDEIVIRSFPITRL